MDVRVTFPAADRINIQSDRLFSDPTNGLCRDFARRVMQSAAVFELTIHSGARRPASAEVRFCTKTKTRQSVVEEICSRLVGDEGQFFYDQSDKSLATAAGSTRRSNSRNGRKKAKPVPAARLAIGPAHEPQMYCDDVGTVRLYRHGPIVSSWKVLHELPGRMRLHHPALHRRKEVCQAIDRELMSVLGVDHYKSHPMSATVLVKYDSSRLRREQVIEILESVVTNTVVPAKTDDVDLHFPLATASLPLAAVAEFALPALLPFSAALFVYTAIPSFKVRIRSFSRSVVSGSTSWIPSSCSAASRRARSSLVRCSAGAWVLAACFSRRRRMTRQECSSACSERRRDSCGCTATAWKSRRP